MVRSPQRFRLLKVSAIVAVGALLAGPQAGAEPAPQPSAPIIGKLSAGALTRHFLNDPAQAPVALREGFRRLRELSLGGETTNERRAAVTGFGPMQGQRFNADDLGLPQNEESITRCVSRPNVVLGGTNDYRGILDPQQNFTGWYLSTNGGRSLRNEGLLPAIDAGGGTMLPSQGDPIDVATDDCQLFAGSLNFDVEDFFPNGVGLYKTTPGTLATCPGGASPSCWPHRTLVARSHDPHVFLDKPWVYAGESGGRTVVWVVYTEFTCPDVGCAGDYTSNSIKAVRCDAQLRCTDPILISGRQPSIQFGDVTVGPDGRTYVTWEQDNDLATGFQPPERMWFWLRVAPPGSTHFGPPRLVAREPKNLGIAPLHANDFRVATYPKNDVKVVNGHQRVYVVWDACRQRPFGGGVCEEPVVKLRYSGDDGATWSPTKVLSAGGDNYFPTISANRGGRNLAVAWFTNRFDPVFHNRQDVELATVRPNGSVADRKRLTRLSNETESDPLLGGFFIGDYIEVYAHSNQALVHYNANYRSIRLLGEGFPVPQQDNYLAHRRL